MDNLMDTVKERANSQFDVQKGRATDGLAAIAGAVRQSTQQLRNDQHDGLAQYVEKAADQLERLSSTLRNKSADELMKDVRQLARRQPALFIGGSFAVGLLAARFIKSSRRDDSAVDHGWPPSRTYSTSSGARDIPARDFVNDVDRNSIGALGGEHF
jgi:hypothetical protein